MRSALERQLRWSNVAFAVTFGLLVVLGGWWIVLIYRLVNENYALRLELEGATPELLADLERHRLMVMGESSVLMLLGLVLVGLAYRYAQVERAQIRRLEGLLAASTHELKTPVAGVRALLESLETGVLPPDRMAPHLRAGLASLGRLEHLIEGILAYQSAIARPKLELRAWELGDLVAEVVGHRITEGSGETIDCDLGDAEQAQVYANADAVRVVLENLLDNARKYGGTQPVRVGARVEAAHVHVTVTDSGAGFPPQDAEIMFEPYVRGSAGQRRHGTGLGLYIARTMARAMAGDLRGASEGPGTGATFTLTLNRADA